MPIIETFAAVLEALSSVFTFRLHLTGKLFLEIIQVLVIVGII